MLDRRDDPVGREKAVHRALVPRHLAPEHLERAEAVVAPRLVHDRVVALADLPLDHEGAERLSDRELLSREERVQIADTRVHLAALEQDNVHEGVETVTVEATLRERAREAPLGGGPPNLARIEPEQLLAHPRHLFEREQSLDLATENVQRRFDLSVHRRGHPRRGENTRVRIGIGRHSRHEDPILPVSVSGFRVSVERPGGRDDGEQTPSPAPGAEENAGDGTNEAPASGVVFSKSRITLGVLASAWPPRQSPCRLEMTAFPMHGVPADAAETGRKRGEVSQCAWSRSTPGWVLSPGSCLGFAVSWVPSLPGKFKRRSLP